MGQYKNLIKPGCLALLLMICAGGRAQTDSCKNKLTVGLKFMTHGEMRAGGLPVANDDDTFVDDHSNFIMSRTRVQIEYERAALEAKAVGQNLAVWGSSGNMDFNLYEAWVKLKAPFGLFGQAGRMQLSYDDERILGPNDWAMSAYSHDLLRLGYEGYGHKIHALLAYNQNADYVDRGTYYVDGAQPYKTMQTLWYHYDVPKIPFSASLLFMNIGMQAGIPEDSHTIFQQLIGTYMNFHPKYFELEGSYYRQMGKTEFASKIEAWTGNVKATVKPTDKYNVEIGFDYLSGDNYVAVIHPGTMGMPHHDVYRGFSLVYGSHHKFFGVMDYFYQSAYINGFTPGLQNAFVRFNCTPITPLTFNVAYHYMAVATTLHNLDKTLGHDIELEAQYTFNKDISLSAGYSYMYGTETMERLKQYNGNKHVNWAWLSLHISPDLFKTKW